MNFFLCWSYFLQQSSQDQWYPISELAQPLCFLAYISVGGACWTLNSSMEANWFQSVIWAWNMDIAQKAGLGGRHKNGLKKHSKNNIDSLTKHANWEPIHFSWLIYWLLAEYNTTWSRIYHPVATEVGWLESQKDIYPCNITVVWRYISRKQEKVSLQRCTDRQNKHNGLYFPTNYQRMNFQDRQSKS